jgi:hypothetical protein
MRVRPHAESGEISVSFPVFLPDGGLSLLDFSQATG